MMKMKLFKRRKESSRKSSNTGYCKKCGCELVSSSKHKLCDHCRRERRDAFKNAIMGIGGLFGLAFFIRNGKNEK